MTSSPHQKRKAIIAAKLYLEMRGYAVLELNWHQGSHGIDIVAQKDLTVCFIDVILNHESKQSDVVDILTNTKLRKFVLAGLAWLEDNKWVGAYTLSTIELSDKNYAVLSFNESVA